MFEMMDRVKELANLFTDIIELFDVIKYPEREEWYKI